MQLRLEAMTQLQQLQEEAIGEGSTELDAQANGATSGGVGGGAEDEVTWRRATSGSLRAAVVGWRQKAFGLLLELQAERRGRQQEASEARAQLQTARGALAAQSRRASLWEAQQARACLLPPPLHHRPLHGTYRSGRRPSCRTTDELPSHRIGDKSITIACVSPAASTQPSRPHALHRSLLASGRLPCRP